VWVVGLLAILVGLALLLRRAARRRS
jgi:hypothetical protein